MGEAMSTEEFARMMGKKKRRSKYNVAPASERTWRGKVYASKAEMLYAQMLEIEVANGWIIEVVEQPRLWLGVRENIYVPDFLIVRASGAFYVDVKGTETAAFRKNKKLWAAYGRLPLQIVALKGKVFHVVEVIQPPARTAA